jgi:hypothetical protein
MGTMLGRRRKGPDQRTHEPAEWLNPPRHTVVTQLLITSQIAGALQIFAHWVGGEIMLVAISRALPELPLLLLTAVATHFFMSLAQTLMHYALGHHPIGGKFFRNHIAYHTTPITARIIILSRKRTLAMRATIRHIFSFPYWR